MKEQHERPKSVAALMDDADNMRPGFREALQELGINYDRVLGIRRIPRDGIPPENPNEPDVEFLLKFNYKELGVLKALLQNPHEAYQSNAETMEIVERMWNDLKNLY